MLAELETQLAGRIPGARLESIQVEGVNLYLLNRDFPRTPLPAEVARAIWDQPPFWAFCWPAGRWLARHLQLPPTRIVDLGCGSGILSIALALRGHTVVAVDSDPEARWACQVNARANGVEFPILESLEALAEPVQLMILADFLYDPANLADITRLESFCDRLLLADCRLQQAPPGYQLLARDRGAIVPDLDWGDEFRQVMIAGCSRERANNSRAALELRFDLP